MRTIHDRHVGWDRDRAAVATVEPGETVTFDCIDASGGQLTPASTAADVTRMERAGVNPTNGPVDVAGAEPGDALIVHIEEITPREWGWTALIPGFGLLAEDFTDPVLVHWDISAGRERLARSDALGVSVPLRPFPGTVGLAPAEPGPHSVIPPRRVGGNLDVRDLAAGTTLWLPVEVAGGRLSVGDTHAAQGDGEVCGTAIEAPATVRLRVDIAKGAAPPAPRFTTPGPVSRPLDVDGYDVTTGVGPDLYAGARDAVRAMIDHLTSTRGLDAAHAYLLCSVAADLRISEIVDAPNWVVGCYFPRVLAPAR